ncbi:protein translocase subunit [Coemansia sp. RSA 1813]|nr:protein translocase subunit [Coemansia sp. RSA 1843]KAJ2091044.1 protein translocase subunit [Coemansia sp. RSA 986]KAJ2215953.1 protein translocase subunit [Coemansia sp. RSA 487]KAJ2570202.1 protein translocase subunit [Coemansia sp. RSA 1813]
MNLSSSPGGMTLELGPGNVTAQAVDQAKQEFKHNLAMANAQELIRRVNDNCFKMCVPAPGPSFTRAEQDSMSRCVDKYLASWDVVAQTYVTRLQRENGK